MLNYHAALSLCIRNSIAIKSILSTPFFVLASPL